MRPNQKVETFPDGIVDVYAPGSGRRVGEKKGSLRFERQSVGIIRFYQSNESVAGSRTDRVIKVPHTRLAARLDIACVRTEDGKQYRINRIQEKPERGVDLWELQSVQVQIET